MDAEEKRQDYVQLAPIVARVEEKVDTLHERLFDDGNGGIIGSLNRRMTWVERIVWMGLGILGFLKVLPNIDAVMKVFAGGSAK